MCLSPNINVIASAPYLSLLQFLSVVITNTNLQTPSLLECELLKFSTHTKQERQALPDSESGNIKRGHLIPHNFRIYPATGGLTGPSSRNPARAGTVIPHRRGTQVEDRGGAVGGGDAGDPCSAQRTSNIGLIERRSGDGRGR